MTTEPKLAMTDTLGDIEQVRAQIAADRDVNRLMPAAVQAEDPAILALLLSQGADPHARNADGEPLLNLAIMALNWHAMDALLDHGADLEASGPGGVTPVLLAATLNQFDQVERLIERGADWRRSDAVGDTVAELVDARKLDPASESASAQVRLHEMIGVRSA